ncbi:MAG: 50S ribosomal protein L29 [Alphaproteobacteria bacterium]|nr:50S ribosomal protein L29 [Alphaproteobacteria bacterium]
MRYAELKELSDQDLVHRELSLERQLVTAQFRLYTNQLEDTSQLGKLRRDIARLQTAARERERTGAWPGTRSATATARPSSLR